MRVIERQAKPIRKQPTADNCASFLAWIVAQRYRRAVRILDIALRSHLYAQDMFAEITSVELDSLWQTFFGHKVIILQGIDSINAGRKFVVQRKEKGHKNLRHCRGLSFCGTMVHLNQDETARFALTQPFGR